MHAMNRYQGVPQGPGLDILPVIYTPIERAMIPHVLKVDEIFRSFVDGSVIASPTRFIGEWVSRSKVLKSIRLEFDAAISEYWTLLSESIRERDEKIRELKAVSPNFFFGYLETIFRWATRYENRIISPYIKLSDYTLRVRVGERESQREIKMKVNLSVEMGDLVATIQRERRRNIANDAHEEELRAIFNVWQLVFPENECVVNGIVIEDFLISIGGVR